MAAMAVSQSLTSKDAAGAAMYKVPMQEKDMQALHEQLLRERSERQRAAQLCKAQEEELKRRERLNSSLWEQRVRLERDASELRGKLARAESQQQKEVHDLTLQLRRCEALHARETSELQREVALHQAALETSRRQLTQARQNGKDREALEEEIQELRGELTQARREMQVRLREQEAEFQKQCLDLKTSRLEEEKRRERLEERRPPDATGLGNLEISKIEGSLEEVSTLSEGAAEAVNKMKLLEDQLRSWQGIAGMENGKSVIPDASETEGSEEMPRSMSKAKVKEVAYQREAELLLEMQQEHLLTIRLNRQAIEARRAAEFRLVRSASLPNSLLDLMRSPPETSKQAVSAVSASVLPRSEPCLRPKLEASPNSAGAVLGSTRSNGGNISASGSPPREMSIAVVREEAKEPSPCSCQALSPAPSLEAATAERPEPPDVEHAGRVPECPFDFGIDRCQSSSPTRAAAGRLPPLAGVEKAPEGGRIGLIADLSPSRRPEVDLGVPPAAVQSAREEVEALPDTLDARLKEAELERASWRRRTLLLEEQMQRLLEQQSSKAEARWRPQALQLEETSEEEEAWKQQKQTLEAQLAQALAERDRMIEATNELRADVRRLTGPKHQKAGPGPAVAMREVPVSSVPSSAPPPGQVAELQGASVLTAPVDSLDRFGAMGSSSSSPRSRGPSMEIAPVQRVAPTLSLPIPAAGTPVTQQRPQRPEVEVPGSAPMSRSASPSPPAGYPPASPEVLFPPPPRYEVVGSPSPPPLPRLPTLETTTDTSPTAMRVRDALKMLSPRRATSMSPGRVR